MKKITSTATFAVKTLFPAAWFGFLALFIILVISSGAAEKSFMLLVIPVLMVVFGFILMKHLLWNVMDEVIDYGDYLVVKYRGQEDVIYLSNIMNVNVFTQQRPPRITLQLRIAGKFGEEVSFFPITEWNINPFKKNKLAEELISRIDQARRKNTA